ncbi:MAG: PfkB family carbohydrate kinase [Acidaminobacteraceae bacterium]
MTNREKEIYKLILENPLISQQEIADLLGIQRSSVAVQISNLTKKGNLRGKGYIVGHEDSIVVIGGANMDILGFPTDLLKLHDSNPGKIRMSMGGVGRNIADNLVRLGAPTKLLTALGNDIYGKKIYDECKKIGMDLDNVIILDNEVTSTYLSILDETGDMKLALSDSDICRKINIEYINKNSSLIKNASCIVLDTNLDKDVLDYILKTFKEVPIFADTVSSAKAVKLKDLLGNLYALKPNKIEAEILTGIEIVDETTLDMAMDKFIELGVNQVYISLGKDGVYYGDKEIRKTFKPEKVKMINATGAGDAFMAGIVYSHINEYSIDEAVRYGSAMARMAITSAETINPDITAIKIENIVKEMK